MSSAMIVSLQPEAVETGAEVLRRGGNAVDAAIACAFVQTVVDPLMCGVAGFGSMHLCLPERDVHEIIDFHGRVPAAATADMWQDRIIGETEDGFGFVLEDAVNDLGYRSITTPGTLKAFWNAHQRYGSIPWCELLAPAIRIAAGGYLVTPGVYGYWVGVDTPGRVRVRDRLGFSDYGRAIYCDDDGHPLAIGATVKNPDMADAYRRIADGGADIFYTGDMATQIDADMQANDALLNAGDLADYQTESAAPPHRNLPRLTNLDQSTTGWRHHAHRDAQHARVFRFEVDGSQLTGLYPYPGRGNEDSHQRQGQPCRGPPFRRRTNSTADRQIVRGGARGSHCQG